MRINHAQRCSVSCVAGYHVAVGGIKLMTKVEHNRERANTGIAFVRFVSAGEAARAATQLHRRMMGPRYIECIYPLQVDAGQACTSIGAYFLVFYGPRLI